MFISIIQHIRENAAGAAGSSVEGMWEVGVDVLEGYRNARLGTWLVRHLTKELTDRNILPFYSASVNKYRLPDGRIPVRIHSGLGGHVWNDPRRKLRISGNCQRDDLSIPL